MNPSPPTSSRSILLVDDDSAILRILDRWLTLAGYQVTRTDHARAAMQAIEQSVPDFIVTDWEMPDIDGLELCRWIRRQTFPHYIYTMFLTSRNQSEDMIRGLDAGADDFIRKPVTKGELLARLNVGRRILDMEQRLRGNDASCAGDCLIHPERVHSSKNAVDPQMAPDPPETCNAWAAKRQRNGAGAEKFEHLERSDKREPQPWSALDNECASLVSELQTLNGLMTGGSEATLRSALDVAERVQSLMYEWQTYSRHMRRRTARAGVTLRHDPASANFL